jgi:predicted amidohydrolase
MGPVVIEDGKARGTRASSNGHSRIIRPDGNLIAEASMFGEDVLAAHLDLSTATRHLAERSIQSPFLSAWWQEGLALVASRPQAG